MPNPAPLATSVIAEAVGAERTVGAFVNFGADYVGPGRIFLGGKGAFYVGEVDGRPSRRVERLVGDIQDAQATDAILGYLWSKQAYGAMLFATAVSDLSIADALAEPRYRRLFLRLAEEMLAEAPVEAPAADDKPRVVTRTRRRSASRPAGPPALPATTSVGVTGTLPESGLVEPGTAGVEPGHDAVEVDGEAPVVEHVPIKKKGSRKR